MKELVTEVVAAEETNATEPWLNEYVRAATGGYQEGDRADGDAEDEVRERCIINHNWSDGEKTLSERGVGDVVEDVFVQ